MKVKIDRRVLKIIAFVLIAVGLLLLLLQLFRLWNLHIEASSNTKDNPASDTAVDGTSAGDANTYVEGLTYYNGKWYEPKKNIETVLLMGLDSFEDTQTLGYYNNTQQADFLLLLVMDQDAGTYTVIQLNRDTMTEIPVLGVTGESAGSTTGQLALAHTYGSGAEDSCVNTETAVSNLLYGVKIDHYISLTMDAVPILNDLVGGVPVTIEDDFSNVDPSLVKGSTVVLKGQQALTFVRARGDMEDSTNINRMNRQKEYLFSLQKQFQAYMEKDSAFAAGAILNISKYMVSDCSASQLSQLSAAISSETMAEELTPAGEAVKGTKYMEFYPDEDKLKQLVINVFYMESDYTADSTQ